MKNGDMFSPVTVLKLQFIKVTVSMLHIWKSMKNIDTIALSNYSFGTITRLNISPFFSKSTTNYLQISTKIVVTYIVDTYSKALWKNSVFICFTMWSTKITVTFVQWVYIHLHFLGSIKCKEKLPTHIHTHKTAYPSKHTCGNSGERRFCKSADRLEDVFPLY